MYVHVYGEHLNVNSGSFVHVCMNIPQMFPPKFVLNHACRRKDDGTCMSFFLDYVCHNVKVLAAILVKI